MLWNKDRSILLSLGCVVVFALCLLALDICAYWLAGWFMGRRPAAFQAYFMASIYLGSVFGWIFLCQLWRLLNNLRRGELFTAGNVKRMRAASWCCFAAAGLCLLSAAYYLPFVFVAVAAAFVGLIVRIVKNAFQQAMEGFRYMKNYRINSETERER